MPAKPKIDTEAVTAAAKTIDEVEAAATPTTVTLKNGISLRLKSVPPFLVQKAAGAVTRPDVPKVYLEDKGVYEDNPADPDYIDAMAVWEAKTIEAGVSVMLAAGTAVDHVPASMEGPDDDGWLELITYFGIDVDLGSRVSRYLTWLLCYALDDPDDLANLVATTQRMTGIREEEAQEALATFRNRAERRAANGASPKAT